MIDGSGVDNVAISESPVGEIGIRTWDFQGFLPRMEPISWLI